MATINTGKVIVGGLLAGLVMNVCDMVWNMVVLKDDMQMNMTKLNLDPTSMNSMAGAAPWIVIDFVLGILIVWNYALIRPRLGPGPKTAVIAGLVPYLAVTFIMYGLSSMGMMPMTLFVKSSALYLVTIVVGSLAGGWAYKEA